MAAAAVLLLPAAHGAAPAAARSGAPLPGAGGAAPASAAPARPAAAQSAVPPEGAGAFRPVLPCRLLDTRDGPGPVLAAGTVDVPVRGRCQAGPTATVALVTVTAVGPDRAGFLTAWPAGRARPLASSLNVVAGDIRANTVAVPLGAAGALAVYAQTRTDLVVDLLGVWEPVAGAVPAGRLVPTSPTRVLDTRIGLGAPRNLGAGEARRLRLGAATAGTTSAVSDGAEAVVLQLTATDAPAPGFVTAWPAGGTRPLASSLNVAPGQTRANLVVVGLGTEGGVDLFSSGGAALVADVVGWISGAPSAPEVAGLLVPLPEPVRVLDTREPEPATRLAARQRLSLRVGGRAGVPPGAAAVAANLTLVDPAAPAWAATWPSGASWPGTSTVNSDGGRGAVAPAGVLAGLAGDRLDLTASTAADLVLDVAGWFVPADAAVPGDDALPVAALARVPAPNDPLGLPPAAVPADVTGVGDADRVVAAAVTGSRATVTFWERGGDGRFRAVRQAPGLAGRSGLSVDRREGDGSTPAGVYALTEAFGADPAPPGIQLPWFRLDPLDWWVSDPTSPAYNTRQRCAPGTCPFDESAGENLLRHGGAAYGLAVVFGYNQQPVVPGRGSAMFLHIWGSEPTSGCVSIPAADLAWALGWLDPARRPALLVGAPGVRPA